MTLEEVKEYAEELIKKNEYAVIGTISKKSYPNTRALKIMEREGFNKFIFSTKKNTLKIEQIKKNKKGCIFFYDVDKYASVMIEGKFEVKENFLYDVSNFFFLHPDPYDFCNIIFEAEVMYVYIPYNKYEIKLK